MYETQPTVIKDLGNGTENLQILEEKLGANLHHVGLGPDFLNKTPKGRKKIKSQKIGSTQTKVLFFNKRNNNVMRESNNWEKILPCAPQININL